MPTCGGADPPAKTAIAQNSVIGRHIATALRCAAERPAEYRAGRCDRDRRGNDQPVPGCRAGTERRAGRNPGRSQTPRDGSNMAAARP
jgi:hypothetical protein